MLGRGGSAPWMWCCSPPSTPLFIGRRGKGAGPSRWDLEGGGGQGGGVLPPKPRGAPPLGFPPTLGAWALGGMAPSPLRGWFPSTYSP